MKTTSDRRVKSPEALPILLTPADIVDILGISRNRVYELMHRDDFPVNKFGKQFRVRADRFFVWLDEHKEIEFKKKEIA